MAKNYVSLPYEYLEEMGDLTDAEFGRLMRALLIYSSTGEFPALNGNERFFRRRVVMIEDRFKQSYETKSQTLRENGKKGGEAKASKPKQMLANASNPNQTEANGSKTCHNTKTNTKTISTIVDIPPISPQGEKGVDIQGMFSPELAAAVCDWLEYKREKKDTYKPKGLKALLTQIQNAAKQYGDKATIDAILHSMASNYQGIVWDRIKTSKKPEQAVIAPGTMRVPPNARRNAEDMKRMLAECEEIDEVEETKIP